MGEPLCGSQINEFGPLLHFSHPGEGFRIAIEIPGPNAGNRGVRLDVRDDSLDDPLGLGPVLGTNLRIRPGAGVEHLDGNGAPKSQRYASSLPVARKLSKPALDM